MILRSQEIEVSDRLSELGLSLKGLNEVTLAGFRARASCSPLHPPTFPGTAAWAASVHTLRSIFLPHGWRAADPGNFSMTINDERRVYIVCATGDENSGFTVGKTPTTKTPKGLRTEVAVKRQAEFWPEEIPAEEKLAGGVTGYTAYWFLLNIVGRKIYAELSSPADIQRGKIIAWNERNVLPVRDLDLPLDDTDSGFTPDFDIDVKRIA